MTDLMEQVLAEISKLPEREQSALAAWIREALDSERRWMNTFAESEDVVGCAKPLYGKACH